MVDHATIPDAQEGISTLKIAVIILIITALAVFPFVITNRFYISMANEMLIYGLLAMSLDVLLGYTGLLSFMHNAYLGISAYVVGIVLIHISPTSLWLASCYVLFNGISGKLMSKLQRIQNTVERVIFRSSKYDDVTPLFIELQCGCL